MELREQYEQACRITRMIDNGRIDKISGNKIFASFSLDARLAAHMTSCSVRKFNGWVNRNRNHAWFMLKVCGTHTKLRVS